MGTTNQRDARLEFAEDKASFNSFDVDLKGSKTIVKQFNEVDSFILQFSEMDRNAEVVSGLVVLHVNDSTWEYDVPPQKPKWGLVTMRRTRDKKGKLISEVKPVPVIDFVEPPRVQKEQVYDGK